MCAACTAGAIYKQVNKVENCPPYGEKCSKNALTWRKSTKNAPHIAKKMLGDFFGGRGVTANSSPPPLRAHMTMIVTLCSSIRYLSKQYVHKDKFA